MSVTVRRIWRGIYVQRTEWFLAPGAWLCAWLALVVLLAVMPALWLSILTAALAAALLWLNPGLLLSVFRRMRYLLLSLLLLMGWTLPGDAVFDSLWAPTWQGLQAGAVQVMRLLLAVWLVRALWLSAGREAMLAALYQLCAPLTRLGLPAKTLALRLWLTLYHADRLISLPFRTLLQEMRCLLQQGVAAVGPDQVELRLCRWRKREYVFVLAAWLITGFLMKVWA